MATRPMRTSLGREEQKHVSHPADIDTTRGTSKVALKTYHALVEIRSHENPGYEKQLSPNLHMAAKLGLVACVLLWSTSLGHCYSSAVSAARHPVE